MMKSIEPNCEVELAEIVASSKGPLAIRGGNTRGVPLSGETLNVSGLSGLVLYEPGALTLVAQAGTPVAEIEAALAEHNQRLAFEPMDHRGLIGGDGIPTIGGVVAGNISGPRRIMAGAARDHLLGVRFVDGQGWVIRNGGRVMKNVTGYDLVKLMAGSWGTLGVLSEVALKVLPMAETQTTVMVRGLDIGTAIEVMSTALGSPYEVNGAAYDPSGKVAMLRIEGRVDSVNYRAGQLEGLLARFGDLDRTASSDLSADMWTDVRDVAAFQGQTGDVWKFSVKPSDAPALAALLQAEALLYDWGGGLVWALVPEGTNLRARAGGFDGHATLVRASAETKARLGMFQPQPAPLEAISAGLRARFDPRGIFNAGLMQPATGV